MRPVLAKWVRDADALRQVEHFRLTQVPLHLGYLRPRADDLYIALTGELFQRIREDYQEPETWARLGNAFGQFTDGRAAPSMSAARPPPGVTRRSAPATSR